MRGVVVDVPRAWRRANRRRVAHCGVECEETVMMSQPRGDCMPRLVFGVLVRGYDMAMCRAWWVGGWMDGWMDGCDLNRITGRRRQ